MNITSQQILGGHVRQKLGNPFVTQVDILVSTIGIINKLIHLGKFFKYFIICMIYFFIDKKSKNMTCNNNNLLFRTYI